MDPTDCDPTQGTRDGSVEEAPYCGDGKLDFAIGEECDDGNTESGDCCTANCQLSHKVGCQQPYPCDDGNTDNGDGCDSNGHTEPGWLCRFPGEPCRAAACGDGIVAGNEECDEGANVSVGDAGCDAGCNVDTCDPITCRLKGHVCTSVCGDGIVACNEQCDLGVNNDDKAYNGCSTQCKYNPYCGDGHVDLGHEDCDDGFNLSQWSATPTGGCAPGCVAPPYCGDGIVQSKFEECDDGVLAGTYGGCAPGCVLGPRCGDGILQKEAGEECDDGNRLPGDSCDPNCKIIK